MSDDPVRLAERLAELAALSRPRDQAERFVAPPDDSWELADADARSRVARGRWARVIPARFARAELGALDPALADRLAGWDGSVNLVLTGPVGVGKTYAAVAALRPRVEQGASCEFWPVVSLLDKLRPSSSADPYEAAAGCDLLVLDDLGAERATEWTAERLYALVNDRWLAELPIIATTNLEPAKLTAAVGERLASRLLGGALIVRLSGTDRRMGH